jgi:hypothetical protein
MINTSFGAELLDVEILERNKSDDGVELKLRTKDGPLDTFFYLDIKKDDPNVVEKLSLVLKKTKMKNKFSLNLDIPSFSLLPSGSYYRSQSVLITGEVK